MPRDIQEIQARLKAILAKADALITHAPPDDEEAPKPVKAKPKAKPPTKVEAPLLLESPAAPPKPVESGPSEPIPEIICLPSAPPDSKPAPIPEPLAEPVPAAFQFIVPGENEIPFLIGYPESELKTALELCQQLELLEPKFTKMEFHLRGYGSFLYSRDIPLQEAGFQAIEKLHRGVLLLITKKKLNSKTIDPLTEELARHGLYFQVVPVNAVAHKAFYFDFLLGLVFFLKAQKKWSKNPDDESEPEIGVWHG